MDIAAMSVSMSAAKVQQQAGIQVMKMAMESQEAMAETVVSKLIEGAVVPSGGIQPPAMDVYV